jgi:DNA polymerase III subunit delta
MSRPPFSFFICPDSWLLQREIARIAKAAGCGEWNRSSYWGDEPLESDFWSAMAMPGMLSLLGEGRIIIVRRANAFTVKIWSDLEPLLRKPKADLWVMFCLEGEWKGKTKPVPAVLAKQPFFKVAQKKKWLWESPGLTSEAIQKEVQHWAATKKVSFAAGVQDALIDLLPLDGARLGHELQKLELALGDRREVLGSHLEIFGQKSGMDNFAFVRDVLSNAPSLRVWRTVLLDHEATGSGMLMPFLGLLQREMRILWMLLHGEEDKVFLYPKAKNEKRLLARSLGSRGIARIIDQIFQAEWDLKSGRKDAKQILEHLVASLSS